MGLQRIRTIKPEFFVHERLAEISMASRLLFIGLWTVADREGRLEDRPQRLKAQLFPYDKVNIHKLLDELARGGFVMRYAVDGGRYLAIPHFTKHQRPNPTERASTIPAPPAGLKSCAQDFLTKEMEVEMEVEGKGNGNGRSRSLRSLDVSATKFDPEFLRFWDAYPRRVGKHDAWKAWLNLDRPPIMAILAALAWQRNQPRWLEDNQRFVPHPTTYLNHRRWEDEPPAPALVGTTSRTAGNVEAIKAGLELLR